jgi:hypothetical protein
MPPGVTTVPITLGSRELVELKGKGILAKGKVLGAWSLLPLEKRFIASHWSET